MPEQSLLPKLSVESTRGPIWWAHPLFPLPLLHRKEVGRYWELTVPSSFVRLKVEREVRADAIWSVPYEGATEITLNLFQTRESDFASPIQARDLLVSRLDLGEKNRTILQHGSAPFPQRKFGHADSATPGRVYWVKATDEIYDEPISSVAVTYRDRKYGRCFVLAFDFEQDGATESIVRKNLARVAYNLRLGDHYSM
jgi:hypothetical protein